MGVGFWFSIGSSIRLRRNSWDYFFSNGREKKLIGVRIECYLNFEKQYLASIDVQHLASSYCVPLESNFHL